MTRRGNKEARVSDNRYYYVMGAGWYALSREGEIGPFAEKHQAIDYVCTNLTGSESLNSPHSDIDFPLISQHG